jgi:hypothetical protein|nr:MAG TPA: Nucleoside deoxyribosyltransferase [Caudoviricetes sp.]
MLFLIIFFIIKKITHLQHCKWSLNVIIKNNMAKIYVASSWRNQHQPQVVSFLREQGHEVYDFRHPAGKTGFQWSQIEGT